MIEQEEISSLIPPDPEEFDHPMGASPSKTEEKPERKCIELEDDDNTQPPKENPSKLIGEEIETLEQKKQIKKKGIILQSEKKVLL